MEQLTLLIDKLLPILTLIIGSTLTYQFGIKSKRDESALKYKEEQYSKLLIKLQGFIGATARGSTKKEFFEEQYKGWLYCSDEVVEAINAMVELVKNSRGERPDYIKGQESIGNIVLAMRKDLYGKTKLDHTAFTYTDVLE